MLIRHSWPGNIRELANALDLAMTLCEGDLIEAADLPDFAPVRALVAGPAKQAGPAPATLADASPGGPVNEQAELRAALIASAGNISESARRLGVDRSTIHRRMKRLGLKAKD